MGSHELAIYYQAASMCLHYPDGRCYDHLALLRRGLADIAGAESGGITTVLDYLAGTAPGDAAQHYVTVFDTKPRRTLYLTWYSDGDTRRRGSSLAELKGLYRTHGFRLTAEELPDYLPVMLEFAAKAAAPGQRLLAGFRPALELLHHNLEDFGTPYAAVVRAVADTLPPIDHPSRPATIDAPSERVGVEPVALPYPTGRTPAPPENSA